MKGKYLIFGFFVFLFWLSFWLMWHTLTYDASTHQILISGKYWSDFSGHLPQIRSFSVGSNWPPQYPLYPGPPSRYHFLFYFLAGFLEKSGLRLDWAVNFPSALGFFFLTVMVYKFSSALFKKPVTSFLSVVFFLFNASFSWLDYLSSQNFSLFSSIINLKSLSAFPAFAPWNSSLITAFWNLNIYTNQRHLGLSFALGLVLIYFLYTSPRRLLYSTGLILGSFLFLNQAVFLICTVFIVWFFFRRPALRLPLLVSLLGFLPWFFLYRNLSSFPSPIAFHPGFLAPSPLTLLSLIKFWFLNLGLHLFLIPIGFFLAPKSTRILIAPLAFLFIFPNLWRLSPDLINNHKLFNFFLILGGMFTAHALTQVRPLWIFTPLLVLGGLVDFFPVKNDTYYRLTDLPANPDAQFFLTTPPDSTILNSTWFYHPASLAGRFVYNGYPYFTWSLGYDPRVRERQTQAVYQADSPPVACGLLRRFGISYVELSDHPDSFITSPNRRLWGSQFLPSYRNPATGVSVYNVNTLCPAPST